MEKKDNNMKSNFKKEYQYYVMKNSLKGIFTPKQSSSLSSSTIKYEKLK
jgi:hypothetical protein